MVVIPSTICEHLALPQDSSIAELNIYIEENGAAFLDGLLSTEASRITAFASLSNASDYILEIFHQTGVARTGFCEINLHDVPPVLVGFVGDFPLENPATALENLLFWGVMSTDLDWNVVWENKEGNDVINWRQKAKGHALVAFPKGLYGQADARRMLCALLSLEHADLSNDRLTKPVTGGASKIVFNVSLKDYSKTQASLLFEAVNELSPKWRCLSLYRILENAYLTNIKSIFNQEFDREPKLAVRNAEKSISSELMQLISLAETQDLRAEFQDFNVEIEKILAQGNNDFIKQLDAFARLDKDNYGSQQIYKKAILRFYKLRCSIAHGGTSSVIFEQFSDSARAVIQLLPTIEAIAMKSMNIRIV
jgi:hypothetical protein